MFPIARRLIFLYCLVAAAVWIRGADRPNMILIVTDDHRYDAMGFMGHPFLETPHLDGLAARGAHLRNAFVTTSLCSPSRASIITGQYAHNHGVVDNYNPPSESLKFFPELLDDRGYQTAFVGKWHMGETDERQRGFDHWVSFAGQGVYSPDPSQLKAKGRYVPQARNTGFNVNGTRVDQKGYITDELTDYAVDWLQSIEDNDEPYFLYLSHKAAHADFLPANRHAFRYDDVEIQRPVTWVDRPDLFVDVPRWVKNQRNSRHGVEFAYYTELDLDNYYRRYCETLLAVDESVGRIVDHLKRRGELESTIILYMGDNGFLFGEKGLIDKRCAYEASARIPLIWSHPESVASGSVVEGVVGNIDVGPTLLDAAGIDPDPQMDGRSFLPLLHGESVEWRDYLLYEYQWERNYPQTPTMHALMGRRYKYIRYHGVWDTDELFDLQEDPHERVNLIRDPNQQERIADLNAKLFELLESTNGDSLPLRPDRGNKFYHRKTNGSASAPFPNWFYRAPDITGR